jgi:hypothetical protein
MTQNAVNYANNPTGPQLLDDYLAKDKENNLTSNSGVQRPSYALPGTKWLDTSTSVWVWNMYDGSNDVTLGTINPTTHSFSAAGLDTAVLLTGNQTVAGVKTFSSSPLVPNVTTGDNSSKAANTAFVTAGLATKQDTLTAGRNITITNNTISSTGGYFPNLFDTKWSDNLLNDLSWLRADTFSWQDGSVYTNAYNHLVDDIDNITAETETIGTVTITFYRATDGHKICLPAQESNVEAIYTATGIAWYYILDTTNARFKLPRTKFGFTGIRNSVGDYVDAGLPNITGSAYIYNDIRSISGVFDRSDYQSGGIDNNGNGYKTLLFDASRSSSIYGNSTTVQPPATEMYLYFYVGEFDQSATEQTAGLNAELFNSKADLSALNNKIQEVSVAPVNPVTGILYVIPES